MRSIFGIGIITLLFALTAPAQSTQSLAEVARSERARRGGTSEVQVYTTEGIQALLRPINPELIAAMEGLAAAFGQLGSELADPLSGLLGAGESLAGGMVDMLQAFEAGALEEIERLEAELETPDLDDEDRDRLEEELAEVEQFLTEVRAELPEAQPDELELPGRAGAIGERPAGLRGAPRRC